MSISPNEFKLGMRRLAAAVSVITTASSDMRNGMTATAVMSLTAEPPQLGVAINRTASSFPLIQSSKCFGVNVLSKDQTYIASVFSGMEGKKGEERFSAGTWETAETGAPLLIDAAACFDCRVVNEIDLGTHVLFVGRIESVRTNAVDRPLLYIDGSWASLVQASAIDLERYRDAMRQTISAIDSAVTADKSPEKQLQSFVEKFARINMSQTEITRTFFGHEAYAPYSGLAEINAMKKEFDVKLQDLLARGVEQSAFSVGDPQMAALAITGMMLWMHRWYSDQGRLGSNEVAQQFSSLVRSMIRVRSSDDNVSDIDVPGISA